MIDFFKQDKSNSAQILTSIVYCLHEDVTNIKPIAKRLDVDANLLISVLAAAVGKTSLIKNFYPKLA